MALDEAERGVEHLATDVLKVAVGVALQRLLEVGGKVGVLVVDAGVGAEALDPLALLGAAGDADDALGADDVLGVLDGGGADGARRARDQHRVLGLAVEHVKDALVRGDRHHAEDGERGRRHAGQVADVSAAENALTWPP